MGLTPDTLTFLLAARRRGAALDEVISLGRQGVFHIPPDVLEETFGEFGEALSKQQAIDLLTVDSRYENVFAEPILARMGAGEIRSVDVSDFESCTDIHDLNRPLPVELAGRFSAVLDLGTLEHVWNYPVAVHNAMRLARPGGHLLVASPTNNQSGHGLYQFSPELFFRLFSEPNGFEIEFALIREGKRNAPWYAMTDPAELGHRLVFTNAAPTMVYICARRLEGEVPTELSVYQSDYAAKWEAAARGQTEANGPPKRARRELARVLPRALKDAWNDQVEVRRAAAVGLRAPGAGLRRVDPADLPENV